MASSSNEGPAELSPSERSRLQNTSAPPLQSPVKEEIQNQNQTNLVASSSNQSPAELSPLERSRLQNTAVASLQTLVKEETQGQNQANPTASSSNNQSPAELSLVEQRRQQNTAALSLRRIVKEAGRGDHHPHIPVNKSAISTYYSDLVGKIRNPFENAEVIWHLGNYVYDRESGKRYFESMPIYVRLGMHFLYYGTGQTMLLHCSFLQGMLKDRSVEMGAAYDSPQSASHIRDFITMFDLQDSLKDLVQPNAARYATFNEFFAREIKPSARPIANPDDPLIISSPADCRLTVFTSVDEATKYWIKGSNFTIARLLGSEDLATSFYGGTISIARLAPQDYHRWHAPTDGHIEAILEIPGTYNTVNPMAVNQPGTLNVFCENRRSVMMMRRKATGAPIAIVAVGAMLVGSIKYNPGIGEGVDVKRGQCLGYFQYGGSTVIVLCPPDEMKLDRDLVETSVHERCETLVRVGWRIGRGPMPIPYI